MTRLFRAMRKDADGFPEVGANARALGVRPGIDVLATLPSEMIQPGQGGLSVSPDDPMNLPYFRRPPGFQGSGRDSVWPSRRLSWGRICVIDQTLFSRSTDLSNPFD